MAMSNQATSTTDYFKFYEDSNRTISFLNMTTIPFTTENAVSSTTTQSSSIAEELQTNISSASMASSESPTAASLLSSTTLAITSTIINNFTNIGQNYTNEININSSFPSYNQSIQIKNNKSDISDLYDENKSNHYLINTSYNNNLNVNDSAKISYESGSNFMLLLEDFGEYFYNFNTSDFNSSSTTFQTNCSALNVTCVEERTSE